MGGGGKNSGQLMVDAEQEAGLPVLPEEWVGKILIQREGGNKGAHY